MVAGLGWLWKEAQDPKGWMRDLRAGWAARELKDPDARLEKYLMGRYGDLGDAAVRERVFVEFFDVDRIRTLQRLVKHLPDDRREASVQAMARWIANYRETLTAEQRAAWSERLKSGEMQGMLRQATAQYNRQDVEFRGITAPVISQLLRTLNELERGSQP